MKITIRKIGLLIVCLSTMVPWYSMAQGEALTLDGTFTWINAARYSVINDESPLNPDNSILEHPKHSVVSEFRPNFKLSSGKIQLIARPRIRFIWEEVTTGDDSRRSEGYSEAELNEGFASWFLSDQFFFTVGLQSYQWGPAEALSPSNRIFHVTALARDVLYEVRGKHIGRLNYSLGQNLSIVLLSEYEQNDDEEPFVAEEPFGSTTALKGEVSWGGGANYFGLVLGGRQHGHPWVGEYASLALPFPDGASIYVDAAHQRGSSAYYPTRQKTKGPTGDTEIVVLEKSRDDRDKVESIAVGGLRYDFIQGTIVRLEYILNEPGYGEAEQDMMRSALASDEPAQLAVREQTLNRALAAGLELPGKRYAFGSLYVPNFLALTDLSATIRFLMSMTDQSANSYVALEYEVGDAGTVFVASSVNSGEENSELAGFTKESYVGGYRHFW